MVEKHYEIPDREWWISLITTAYRYPAFPMQL
jgi:hypothetical protein